MLRLLATAVLLLTTATAQTLPTGCNDPPGNNAIANSVVAALESARPLLLSGIPSMGIPPLDPFGPLPSVMFNVNNEAIKLDGSVNKTTVRNLAEFIICKVAIQVGLSQKFDIEFRLDNFHVDGLYDMNGIALSLFPIFGNGNYTLDTYQAGFEGSAALSINVFTGAISIKNLKLDVFFETLVLEMECILGCGDMANFVNKYLSEIGASIFNVVWEQISPIIAGAVEDVVNDALNNVTLEEVMLQSTNRDLGNANFYMDMMLRTVDRMIRKAGLDPAPLPDTMLHIDGLITADLLNGTLTGLSTVRRSGTATIDTVADWNFLYANIALGPLQATYPGVAQAEDGTTDSFDALVSLEVVDVYITARGDKFTGVLDLDQFVISDLGPANVEIHGLGMLGWIIGPLSESILNLFMEDIESFLTTQLKDTIQDALNETPWPNAP